MDDDRNKKPHQKIYTPGSGPLRKSTMNAEGMESLHMEPNSANVSKGRGHGRLRMKHYSNERLSDINENLPRNKNNDSCDSNNRKPSQKFYSSKSPRRNDKVNSHQGAFNEKYTDRSQNSQYSRSNDNKITREYVSRKGRNYRQYSEPRNISPFRSNQENHIQNRNTDRDTKSMEPSSHRQGYTNGGKPPSGRRNSSGYSDSKPQKFIPPNLDNLPPRLRKKYLAESGQLSLDSATDYNTKDTYQSSVIQTQPMYPDVQNSPSVWSQTLPSRGRGRLKDPNFDHEKFIASYKKNFDSLHSTPSSSSNNLHELGKDFSEGRSLSWRKNSHTPLHNGDNFRGQSRYGEHNVLSRNNYNGSSDNRRKMQDRRASNQVKSNVLEDNKFDSRNHLQSSNDKKIDLYESKSDNEEVDKGCGYKSSSATTELDSLDWTEEVEKNIKLENLTISTFNTSTASLSPPVVQDAPAVQDAKPPPDIQKQHKRSGRSKHNRDKRSSSRNNRERSIEQPRPAQQPKPDLMRRNSTQEAPPRHRERRDSHRSNRSSNFGSREDLDKWRSWRSYSREQSLDRKIVSQSNSRDPSMNRAGSPRVDDGFKVPEDRGHSRRSQKHKGRCSNPPAPTTSLTNWREEIKQNEKRTERRPSTSGPPPGVLVLPPEHSNDNPRNQPVTHQRTLFDHQNPSKPIVVQAAVATNRDNRNEQVNLYGEAGNAEAALLLNRGIPALIRDWSELRAHRKILQNALRRLLVSDMKHCQTENVEHHYWKILYYNFIELLRKSLIAPDCQDRDRILDIIMEVIEEGIEYFEDLIELLERTYKFKVEDMLNQNYLTPPKGLGFTGLALVSIQKMYIFLGDLARYKEQVKETNNYGKSKMWYSKAQQINPKNGRPYNQLAILAVYARRKLDAVYYYMRSLMSSNPFHSARESLISLFDENRKKYEAADRKRRATRAASRSVCGGALRREVWLRPGGTRTTSLHHQDNDSDQEDEERLQAMSSVELNKSFIMSYLHVHGKLVTKIGMETFVESAMLMLRQFRALLRQQPLPTTSHRLLQLTALNMFAVETCSMPSQRESFSESQKVEERTPWLDCALSVSLLMFGVMLERVCALLPEPSGSQGNSDAILILPAIKVWCDWMLCHTQIWNPPPSLENFNLGRESDPWDCLAKFMNILEEMDDKKIEFENQPKEGYDPVRLEEDAAMAGFTPLMYMEMKPAWAPRGLDLQFALRVRRLLFFGSEYLCGTEPPVLRLVYSPTSPPLLTSAVRPRRPPANDVLRPVLHEEDQLHDVSEDDETEEPSKTIEKEEASGAADEDTRKLLRRRTQLEQRKQMMERRRQRMQEIVRSGFVSVEMEVRPRWLVPDTNCFIDHLNLLQKSASAGPYTLAVPIVVISELEGLSRCERVGDSARMALAWLTGADCPSSVKFATSRGNLLTSASFTAETSDNLANNDDRVLSAAVSLHTSQTQGQEEQSAEGTRRIVRAVVLLTDDRNLRVKALAADLPARDLPAFWTWAALN